MPKIPLYEERVAPTTQIAGAQARGADLPYKALAGVGDTIAQIGFKGAEMAQEYQERKQKLKADSDLSDYEVTRTQFEAELEQKKNDAMMSGTSYQDVYDNVVVPSLQQFGQEIEGRNYSEESLAKIGQRWGIDSAKMAKSAIMEREQLELEDYTMRRTQEAELRLGSGDEEGANAIFDDLRGIVGDARVNQAKSSAWYNKTTLELQAIENDRLDEKIDDDEYFQRLDDLQSGVRDNENLAKHANTIEIQINSKKLNFKGKRVKARDKAIKDFKSLRDRDEVTADSIEELERVAGKPWADAFRSTIRSAVSVKATSDKDVEKIDDSINGYKNGELSAAAALQKIEKAGGQYAEMGVWLIGQLSEDKANNDGYVVAYDDNWNGVASKVTSSTSDFVDNLSFYMANQEKGKRGSYYAQGFMAYDKWRENNPSPKKEDYVIWRNEYFKSESEDYVRSLYSPQTKNKSGGFEVGKVYIDAGGNRARWNGESWEGVK
jgi:hypothetical protein